MSGFVYFITPEAIFHRLQDDEVCLVKIGYTGGNPFSRLDSLQTGSPVPLVLHAYIDGSLELERAFHEAFAQSRMIGEWFHVSLKVRDFLGYLECEGDDKFVPRERLLNAISDVIFATGSPYPEVSDRDYCRLTAPHHLAAFFPEVWQP